MPQWSVYYSDGSRVDGGTVEEWRAAPSEGVQAVVLWEAPAWDERRWVGVEDRKLWTGEDVYDPFGWGVKLGEWIADADYEAIWREAFYGDR